MSTISFVVFKYRGEYYVFYNQRDGYPDIPHGLRCRIIRNLEAMTKGYAYRITRTASRDHGFQRQYQ